MNRLRFVTARDLFDAFPTAAADVAAEADDSESIAFMQKLARDGKLIGALSFCAYLLPRREAVHWACDSVRALPGAPSGAALACLETAERWVRTPDEPLRFEAARTALASEQTSPATFAAYAAGYAGRNLTPPEFGIAPAPEQLTAQSVRCVFLLAKLHVTPDAQPAWYTSRLERGIKLATGPDKR